MAQKKDYVPGPDDQFYQWQDDLLDTIQPSVAAWGILPADFTDLQAKQTVYDPLYQAITNEGTRTRADVTAHRNGRKTYEKAIRKFVAKWLAKNDLVTADDREELQITIPDEIKTARPKIETTPNIKMKSQEGARITVECRVEADSSRASMHPDCDELEAYFIIGTTAPASPNACNRIHTSSKAKLIIELDIADAGKRIYIYFRWKNKTDKNKNGPWTQLFSAVISD